MKVKIDDLAVTVMKELEAYEKMSSQAMKLAVKEAGKTVKKEIEDKAPKNTGVYAKSWRVGTLRETSNKLEIAVYNAKKPSLTHLLEHGHANRGGGRTRAFPHIAPAQEIGEKKLNETIERALKNG